MATHYTSALDAGMAESMVLLPAKKRKNRWMPDNLDTDLHEKQQYDQLQQQQQQQHQQKQQQEQELFALPSLSPSAASELQSSICSVDPPSKRSHFDGAATHTTGDSCYRAAVSSAAATLVLPCLVLSARGADEGAAGEAPASAPHLGQASGSSVSSFSSSGNSSSLSSSQAAVAAAGVEAEAEAAAAPAAADPQLSIFGLPAASLRDRFDVDDDSPLGSGQFGTVRRCVDRVTGGEFAVKTVPKNQRGADDSSDSDSQQQREEDLRREVYSMMRAAGHANVVQLRAVFEEETEVHLVMELCEGGELFDEILRRQRFPEAEAAQVFAQVASAVAHCHARGVIHRDLKPENILLSSRSESDGEPGAPALAKLADFGLAVTISHAGERVKGVAGSPFYMAPEVLDSHYDAKADVWSLGIILYILLSGSPPFWGETDADVFDAIRTGDADFGVDPWPSISVEAKSLIQCLLSRDPARRPSAQRILSHPWLRKHGAGPVGSPVSAARRIVVRRKDRATVAAAVAASPTVPVM